MYPHYPFNPYGAIIDFRRQIMSKGDPRAERVQYYVYSNEAER